jgi:hypothetical protein
MKVMFDKFWKTRYISNPSKYYNANFDVIKFNIMYKLYSRSMFSDLNSRVFNVDYSSTFTQRDEELMRKKLYFDINGIYRFRDTPRSLDTEAMNVVPNIIKNLRSQNTGIQMFDFRIVKDKVGEDWLGAILEFLNLQKVIIIDKLHPGKLTKEFVSQYEIFSTPTRALCEYIDSNNLYDILDESRIPVHDNIYVTLYNANTAFRKYLLKGVEEEENRIKEQFKGVYDEVRNIKVGPQKLRKRYQLRRTRSQRTGSEVQRSALYTTPS